MNGVRVLLVVVVSACATTAPEPPSGPVIEVQEREAGARGAACGVKPEIARGAPPADARVIVEIEMTSARPESMRAFEDLAQLKALEVCATNVSLLRAVDDDGRGILSVTAALWERPPATP